MDSPSHASSSSSSSGNLDNSRLPLARLVSHFVAAKRSLSATNDISHANEIVADGRTTLENIIVLDARVSSLSHAVNNQLILLRAIRQGLGTVETDVATEFKGVLKNLDSADEQIKHALLLLQTTAVEPALRPAGEKSKTLQDFVDEQAVEELTAAFRECIDRTTEAQSDFADLNGGLDSQINKIQELLSSVSFLDPNFDYPDTVSLFRSLESHATETADLLQSLVRHYDLCVTALKHTEGGGEAAQEAQVDLPPALHGTSPEIQLEPISEKEREEMLQVLNKDAEEVTDVVEEIRERVAQMESQYEQIKNQERVLQENELSILSAISLLDANSASLPRYVRGSGIFLSRWNEIQQRIDEKLEMMESLRDFYTGFLNAYDGLLIEIGRRKSVKARIDRVIQDSLINIDSLLDEDAEERQAFRSEHGEYLPSDIWSGLGQTPSRYELRQMKDQEDEMPDLPSGIIKKAIDRTKRRGLQ